MAAIIYEFFIKYTATIITIVLLNYFAFFHLFKVGITNAKITSVKLPASNCQPEKICINFIKNVLPKCDDVIKVIFYKLLNK